MKGERGSQKCLLLFALSKACLEGHNLLLNISVESSVFLG